MTAEGGGFSVGGNLAVTGPQPPAQGGDGSRPHHEKRVVRAEGPGSIAVGGDAYGIDPTGPRS
ncbi:hypothetical protein ACWGB8_32985 [Kitasatospora sp. NPDC054939]